MQIRDEAMAVLRSIYGQDIPDPTQFFFTRWGGDGFAAGSYSYVRAGRGCCRDGRSV